MIENSGTENLLRGGATVLVECATMAGNGGGDGSKPKKPAGWYGKEARAARAAAWLASAPEREARKAEKLREAAAKAAIAARFEPVRASARTRLATLPANHEVRDPAEVRLRAAQREAKRVRSLLRRGAADAEAERQRRIAEDKVEAGEMKYLDETIIPPTREQMRSGSYEPYTVEKTEGTVRSVTTLRRVTEARIVQLHARGVLTDDTYPAVLWYRRQWEATGFETLLSASRMAERSAGGERAYGHMARTAIELESRFNLHFAASFIPVDMLGTFDRVVLEEMTISDAARVARCRYANVTAVIRHSALLLLGGIAHLLPVRAVGAPGSSPVVLSEPETADFEEAAHEPGAVTTADPKFLDERGYMRPWSEISAILRGEPVEDGDEAP